MSDYNELLKTIDDALAQTDKAQEPKNPTQAILDEIDAALGEKPEAAPVPSVTPAPVPSVTPQPEVAVTPAPVATPQPSPTPSPVSQPVAELPKPTPSRLPEPTPPKEPEVDYSLPSTQALVLIDGIPEEKWPVDVIQFLNTLTGEQLNEVKKQRPDIVLDDILNQRIFDYKRETNPYKFPETKEDFYNLTKAVSNFVGRDIPVMASELIGGALVGGAKAVKQGVPFLLGQTSDYAKGLEAEQLLSPEKQQEVQAWRKRAWEIANTPLKGGEQPNPNTYTDAKYLEKIKEGLTEEQIQALDQKYEQERMEAKQVAFESTAPLARMPVDIAGTAVKFFTGGFQTWDSISEQAGLLTKEQAFERWKTRELLDSVKAKMELEEPRAWARAMDVYYAPTLSVFSSSITPSVQEMMIMDPTLTKEEAESKRKATIESNVLDSIEEVKKSIPETDPDLQAFANVALPGGFGIDNLGFALNVLNASKKLTPLARLKFKKLLYTDDQINAIEAKAQRILKEKQLKELESKKTAGLVERAAGATAKGIEATGEYLERSPKFQAIARYTPYVAGAALGYEINPENPLQSLVVGGITTKLGLKGAKYAGKTLLQAPKVIKEISAARRISAGGEMGPLATLESIAKQQDEVKNLTAKLKTLSEGTEEYIDTKKLLDDAKDKAKGIKEGGGEVVDYEGIGKVSDTTKNILRFASDDLISNIGEYAKMGIEPTILGLSMGMIDSSDEEELKGMIGSGLVFSLGGRAMQQGFHKFLGEDPVIAARKSRQASMDALKAYRDSSPETQGEIDRLTDWTNVLQRQENKIGQAQSDLQGLQSEGASPDKIKKAEKVLSAEQKSLSLLKTANVQTRNEFGKNFLQQLARNNMLINGSLKAGQNNVGFHILSTQQIFDHFRKKPEYRDVSDEDLMMSATQQGFYSGTGGNEYRPGMEVSDAAKGLVFDTSKPSIVVNSDALQNRMMIFGETPTEALNHETGHHFARIPEIQNAMGDARKVLFTNEIKDASGAVKEISNGLYSEKQLNEMFVKDYLKNRPKDQVAEIAKNLGVWDYNTNSLNAKDVGSYMQEEILAELFSNTLSRNLGKNLDSKQLHLLDVARFKMKNNLLKNAVTKVLGLGASSDVVSELTNAKLPPEAQSAARNAVRLIQSMNGDFSTMASMPQAAPISKAEIKKSKIAAERYGMDSGLFATKVVAQVFDADGNPVGAAVDVNDPSVYEGSWRISKDGEERLSGYGQIPVQLRQLQVPEGGTLSIAKQVATEVDGVTPKLLNPKDLKKLQQDRASLFKQAIDTPDYGTPGRFEAVSEGSQTYRGSFTPMQIKAIQDLPEGIVPLKIKKYLLDLNEAIVKKDGTRFYVDYAAVMDDKGNYKAFSPKIYDVVPIGLHLSKDGNFLVTTISAGRMIEKLNLWSDRMPNRLNPWGGSKEAFWADFSKKYLDNWTRGIEGSGYDKQGQPIGTNQLDADVQAAEVKKSILNDFLNLFTNETQALNLDRTTIPKRKGDPKNKSLDRTIMSMRIDHMAELLDADHLPKLPIDYEKAKLNFMPEDPIEAETERYPTSERGMYSGLQKTIDEKVQGKFASPDQLKAIVTNPQNAKAEELKWSGVLGEIDRLAAENQGKVPKDKVMDYLRNEGAVKFEEVVFPVDPEIEKEWNDEWFDPNMYRSDRAKFGKYQLPGGTNYREVVMTMPVKQNKPPFKQWFEEMNLGSFDDLNENQKNRLFDQYENEIDTTIPTYTSSHFPDTPNYVAHMRLNERTDAQGNKGDFIEEFQSDRHQAGREKGYIQDVQIDENRIFDDNGVFRVKGVYDPSVKFKTKGDALEYIKSITLHGRDLIPDAPFRKDWSIQLFKRALRDAVDSDKKWIGWTTGDTQAERYDLSKQVDAIDYSIDEDGLYSASAIKGKNEVFSKEGMELSEVEATFGKELAQKMQENKGKKRETEDGDEYHSLSGLDLKVGGEGMKGFYDQILPKEIGKYVGKMGGNVEKNKLSQSETFDEYLERVDPPRSSQYELNKAKEEYNKGGAPIWKVNITPEMAGKVRGGQLQFMPAVQTIPERFTGTGKKGEERRGRYVAPPEFWTRFDIGDFNEGGKFFDLETGEDITNKNYATGTIDVTGKRPSLVSDSIIDDMPDEEGRTWKTNLFRKSAGWNWISENPPEVAAIGSKEKPNPVLVSVENNPDHFYSLKVDFPNGVKLARYPKGGEPRLRPTKKGQIKLGNEVGRIRTSSGKEHIVYDSISIGKPQFMPADSEYLNLAKDPEKNREQLQGMVDVAAKLAGLQRVFHGSPKKFRGSHFKKGVFHDGFFFTNDLDLARYYAEGEFNEGDAENVREFYIPKADHLIAFADQTEDESLAIKAKDHLRKNNNSVVELADIKDTYAGEFYQRGTSVFAVWEPSKIKSADPVTYDDNGNAVPLSQRFNPRTSDIRFMPAEQPTEYEPISARIRPLQGISAPTKQVGAKALSLGEIEPPVRGKAMLPDMELKPDISEKGIQSSDIITSAKPAPDAVIKPFSNALVSSAGLINFLPAWHGTPHEVDKFRVKNIGTGEGAQAYGWGLYFGQARSVGEKYRENLSEYKATLDGRKVEPETLYVTFGPKYPGYLDGVINSQGLIERWLRQPNAQNPYPDGSQRSNLWNEVSSRAKSEGKGGNLYKVDLDVKDEDLLDWDKPLSEQSEKVKSLITKIADQLKDKEFRKNASKTQAILARKSYEVVENSGLVGDEDFQEQPMSVFYNDIAQELSKQLNTDEGNNVYTLPENTKATSELLLASGIPGIRYLDGMSRTSASDINRRDELLKEGAQLRKTLENNPKDWEMRKQFKDWLTASEQELAALEKQIKSAETSPTNNYVIFDENLITILDKNDKPVQGELPRATGLQFMPASPVTKTQTGYDYTYLDEALKNGKNGKVALTRPVRADEALPLLSQRIPITNQVDRISFDYLSPAEVEFYQYENNPVSFKFDPALLKKPVFKDAAVEHAGKNVQLAMADRQTASGGDMGGIMFPWLKSNIDSTVIGDDGIEYRAVWGNQEWKPVLSMKNKNKKFDAYNLLTYLMGPDAHASNTREVRNISNEIANAPLSKDQKELFLILANIGVKKQKRADQQKNIKKANVVIEKTKKLLLEAKDENEINKFNKIIETKERNINIAQSKFNKFLETVNEELIKPIITKYKTSYTRFKGGTGSEKNFIKNQELLNEFKTTKEFKDLIKLIGNKQLISLDNTFKGRKASVAEILGFTINDFNVDNVINQTMDFKNARNNQIVGNIELSRNPDLMAVYLGDDPKQAKRMTAQESKAAAQLKANPNFVIHEAYAWAMLGPVNGNHFLNSNPKTHLEYFPDFKEAYANIQSTKDKKKKILEGNETTLMGAMRDNTKMPLAMPKISSKK